MLGAITGDLIGSSYEFNNVQSKDFPLITGLTHLTDDSIMTFAVLETLLDVYPIDYSKLGLEKIRRQLIENMKVWQKSHPRVGYGPMFRCWLAGRTNYLPYNSYGNGAGMRVSPVGWLANTEEEVKLLSQAVTDITHNHPEGIKGAEAVAMSIFLARNGKSK